MSGGASLPASPNLTSVYQPANQAGADSQAYSGASNLNTQAQNINSAYDSGSALSGASNLTSQVPGLTSDATSALNMTAFNPALYNQEFQQQQDQTNVANAQNGVAGTPYGAALSAQANQNFNNTFNQNQIGLENTAANTASTLNSAASNDLTSGTATGQSVATLPLTEQQTAINDFLSYLGLGTSAAGTQNQDLTSAYSAESNAALGNQQLENSALSGLGSGLGTILGMKTTGGGSILGSLLGL